MSENGNLKEMYSKYIFPGGDVTLEALSREVGNHALSHCRGKAGVQNICVVHPYYFETDTFISERTRKEGEVIAGRIEDLVRNVDRTRFKLILFENITGYASRTHGWAEEGLIDLVIINPDAYVAGYFMHDNGFSGSRQNYIGGAYGFRSIRSASNGIRRYAPFGSVKLIKDAILYKEPLRDVRSLIERVDSITRGITIKELLKV